MNRLWIEDWTLSENCELWGALSEGPEYLKRQLEIAVSNFRSSTKGQRLPRGPREWRAIRNMNGHEKRRGS
jgi:hypothetical protein